MHTLCFNLDIKSIRHWVFPAGFTVYKVCNCTPSTFVGAIIQLKKVFGKINEKRINNFLMKLEGVMLSWRRNPPMALNMGEV